MQTSFVVGPFARAPTSHLMAVVDAAVSFGCGGRLRPRRPSAFGLETWKEKEDQDVGGEPRIHADVEIVFDRSIGFTPRMQSRAPVAASCFPRQHRVVHSRILCPSLLKFS